MTTWKMNEYLQYTELKVSEIGLEATASVEDLVDRISMTVHYITANTNCDSTKYSIEWVE